MDSDDSTPPVASDGPSEEDSSSPYDESETTATDENMNSGTEDAEGTTTCTLHIPSWMSSYDMKNNRTRETRDQIEGLDWVPMDLKKEVLQYCYKAPPGRPTTENARDMTQFEDCCQKLFPKGRIFASHKQLSQVAEMFLSSWGVKKTQPGQCIKCFYGKQVHGTTRRNPNAKTKRVTPKSPKAIYNCPFHINYTLCGRTKVDQKAKVPSIFYKARITTCNFTHTCNPSTIAHRLAIEKSGQSMPNLTGVQGIITLLRSKPTLPSSILRPLLKDHIPWFKPNDAKFIANFRRKALKFIYENTADAHITPVDLLDLMKKNSAANEATLHDSPLCRKNLQDVLRTVMQEGPDIWDALMLLKKLEKLNPGLEYRIRYDPVSSKPEAVCWMLPEMRTDAIRYGDLIFLDAQKRDMNEPGWCYIGPCVKDNENSVRVIAECLCISESIVNYVWVMNSIAQMEPNFELQNVKIVFADQVMTDTLLEKLNIQDTCRLHGDYYHNMNKVFPETFGNKFEPIRKYLKAMLIGDEVAWHDAYQRAHDVLVSDPEKCSSLEQIYRRSVYFSCWKIQEIEGNLFCKGSVAAEQNHASIVAHLGKGGKLSIAEHITKLCERQVFQNTKRQKEENLRRSRRRVFTSSRAGQVGANDVNARKVLSSYAWEFYNKEMNVELDYMELVGGGFEFWLPTTPKAHRRECRQHFFWDAAYKRCPCLRRKCLAIQCRHEFARSREFDKTQWSSRWLNDETFRAEFGIDGISHSAVAQGDSNLADQQVHNDDLDGDFQAFASGKGNANAHAKAVAAAADDLSEDGFPSNDTGNVIDNDEYDGKLPAQDIPTYQSLTHKMSELARLVQRDTDLCISLDGTIDAMMDRIRHGRPIEVHFVSRMNVEVDSGKELPGRLGRIPNPTNMKRLKSRHEHRSGHMYSYKRPRISNDNDFVTVTTKTKTCSFCKFSGHTVNHCPKIEIWDKGPIKSSSERAELVENLSRVDYYAIDQSMVSLTMDIASTIPKGSRGLMIHQKKKTKEQVIFFDVTFLNDQGNPHVTYSMYPFSKAPLLKFINRSESNIVICQLRRAEEGSVQGTGEDQTLPHLHTQNSFAAALSQASMPDQYRLSQQMVLPPSAEEGYLDKMGYGGGTADI